MPAGHTKDGHDRFVTCANALAQNLNSIALNHLGEPVDALKHRQWAQELYKTGKIYIDYSDWKNLRDFVEKSKHPLFVPFIKADILIALDEAQREHNKSTPPKEVTDKDQAN